MAEKPRKSEREARRAAKATTTTAAPVIATHEPPALGIPTGKIPTTLKIAYGRGDPWSNVTVDAPFHERYGNPYGIAAMLMAMEVVETGGRMIPNSGGSGAYGIMQIKEANWGWLAKQLGVDLQTREGQIATAAAILGKEARGANPRERFLYSYYPVLDSKGNLCLDCKGEDGGTPRQYLADIDTLVGIINAAAHGTTPTGDITPAPKPDAPKPVIDPYQIIFNGRQGQVSYGFGADVGLDYYRYGVGHGTSRSTQHTGDDVPVTDETPLFAPFDAEVTCVGAAGRVIWGQACGYYNDYTDNTTGHDRSIGNITLLGEGAADGYKLVLGHCSDATVVVGQHVKAGQLVGYSGGMNGPHTHVEVAVERNGSYWLLDPRPALITAMGGVTPVVYAERIPIPQPAEFDVAASVRAVQDGVPVLQRASLDADPVRQPLTAGEEFDAVYQVIGNDRRIYWISSLGSRIPVEGTTSEEWTA